MICADKRYSKSYKTYFGGDVIDKFLNDIKESDYCSKIIETEFNKRLDLTKKDPEGFKSFTNCWVCKKKHMNKVK